MTRIVQLRCVTHRPGLCVVCVLDQTEPDIRALAWLALHALQCGARM